MFFAAAEGFEVVMKRVLLGLFLFGLIELALLIKAGQLFGTLFPITAVVLSMAAGGLVIRHYGLKTLGRLKETLRAGGPPTGSPLAGLAGVVAGILLILPGFLSDFCALLLLIPVTRRIVAAGLGWRIVSPGPTRSFGYRANPRGPIIEAEAVEIHGELSSERPESRPSPWRR
jgi:UPF0716 protein FxsA